MSLNSRWYGNFTVDSNGVPKLASSRFQKLLCASKLGVTFGVVVLGMESAMPWETQVECQ
jgi:hypothetical protein